MKKLKYFSGIKPTVEDLEFDQAGKEDAIAGRQREMFSAGVLTGLQLIEDNGGCLLQPGTAYIAGERIELTEEQTVVITPTQEPQYVILKHIPALSHPVNHFITNEEHLIYQDDGFEINIRNANDPGNDEITLASVTDWGITDLREYVRVSVDDRIHQQNCDTGTTASEFRIGVGQPDNPEGLPVVTVDPAPRPPLFPRIVAIQPDAPFEPPLAANPQLSSVLGTQSGSATVVFCWNFLNITGTVVNSYTFRIEASDGYSFAAGELQDYYIRFHEAGDFRITGNQVTDGNSETLITVAGDISEVSTAEHPAVIHPDVTQYRWSLIPVEVEPETPIVTDPELPAPSITVMPVNLPETIQGVSSRQSSPVAPYCAVRLPMGRYFMFTVQSVKHRSLSSSVTMTAGSYGWQGVAQNFTCPFLVQLPVIETAELTLTALSDGKGFIAQIEGWEDAEYIEYAWKGVPAGQPEELGFNNRENHPGISRQDTIQVLVLEDILAAINNPHYQHRLVNLGLGRQVTELCNPPHLEYTYQFSCRPITGRQVVGSTVSGLITLSLDPNQGQTPVITALQSLAVYCDVLNMNLQNINAQRIAQAELMETQLEVLDQLLTEPQAYSRYSLQTNLTLPFPEAAGLPSIGGVGGYNQGANQLVFQLNTEQYQEQIIVHNIGHLNYMVVVRDSDGLQVDADIDLDPTQTTVKLAEAMNGTILVIY